MRTLDRYIMRQLVAPIIFCSVTLILLVLFADVFDRLGDFIKNQIAAEDILKYYLSLVPVSFVQTIPWATFLGTIYVLTLLNRHNELLAMKTAGVRITAIIRPMVYIGFVVGVICFIVNDRIVPKTYMAAEEIRQEKIEAKTESVEAVMLSNVTHFGQNNRLYYIRQINKQKNSLDGVIILELDKEHRVREKLVAEKAVIEGDGWILKNVSSYNMDRKGRLLGEPKLIASLPQPKMTERFDDFVEAAKESQFLSYKELKRQVKHLKKSGLEVDSQMVDLQHKLAFPWASLVMMLVTIPFLSRTLTRKGIALSVLMCLFAVFAYYALDAIILALGKSGTLPPVVSAWAASLLFTAGAVFFLERANY